MNLYLSSYRIPTQETLFSMLPAPVAKCLVGIIRNAKDYRENPDLEQVKLESLATDLHGLGFGECVFIDLLKVDDEFSFDQFDVVYGAGGNTFALNYALHHSGQAENLIRFIENGGVYVGESAGAIIIGKSIRKFDTVDDEKRVPRIYPYGLEILPQIIAPHADSPDVKDQVYRTVEKYEDEGEEVIVLNDNQAFVVNGDKAWIDTGVYFSDENRNRT